MKKTLKMPVQFRGVSEYSSMFKWQPSFKSSEFYPHKTQLQPNAGLRSDEFNLLMEPGFSKKKQVPHRRPEAGDCLVWWHDDFEESESERSQIKEKKNTSKPLVFSAKGDGNSAAGRIKEKKVLSVYNDIKIDSNQENVESKCTWEKDKQSEYVQNLRKSLESSKETKISPKSKTSRSKQSSSKNSSPKKNKISSSKPTKSTPTKPKISPKTSPTKIRVKSPEKQGKANSRPLRYRPLHHRMLSAHQSEYQQMYKKPTRFVPSSPLISAHDVVHSSSPAIPPHRSPKMLCKTEYASKFEKQTPLDRRVPNNASSPPSPSLQLKVRDLPVSAYVSRHSPQKLESEYADQFPSREYPAEFKKRLTEEAQHNKLNREGSAFDKDHVNQICSPTNKVWDLASVSASSEATDQSQVTTKSPSVKSNVTVEQDKEKLSTVVEDDEDIESVIASEKDSLDTKSTVTSSTLNQSLPVARKLAWGEDDDKDVDKDDNSSTTRGSTDSNLISNNGYEGRIPTPQLKKIGGALRSHHDLTTPSPGGALLTSPTSSEKKKRFVRSSPSVFSNNVNEKPIKLSKTAPTPTKTTAAKPAKFSKSADRSLTREENDSTENSCQKEASNAKPKRKPDLPRFIQPIVRAPIHGALRSQEFQHCGKHSRPSTAFDRLSLASRASIASADDLLQRSLQRRDFWKTS